MVALLELVEKAVINTARTARKNARGPHFLEKVLSSRLIVPKRCSASTPSTPSTKTARATTNSRPMRTTTL